MSWKSFIKEYFSFSWADRIGIVCICLCILLILIIKWSLPWRTKHSISDIDAYEKEIVQFRRAADSVLLAKDQTESSIQLQSSPDFFYFDPNLATDDEWERLGLNERQIRNIRNYLASGGSFKRKDDLQKLYTIPITQYRLLEPYIRVAVEPAKKQTQPERYADSYRKVETKTLSIELNTADSSLLTQLPGIGPVLASRTVRYRNRIGGYTHVAQLSEVYGIDHELVERLASYLSVDSSHIRTIHVNSATFRDLISHPYLNEQQVRGILNYRNLQKRINNMDELIQNNILKPEEADRIRPYLNFY